MLSEIHLCDMWYQLRTHVQWFTQDFKACQQHVVTSRKMSFVVCERQTRASCVQQIHTYRAEDMKAWQLLLDWLTPAETLNWHVEQNERMTSHFQDTSHIISLLISGSTQTMAYFRICATAPSEAQHCVATLTEASWSLFFCGMPCKPTEWMKRSRKSECEMKWSTPPPTIVKLVLLCLSNLYTSLQAPAPDHLLSEVQVEQIPLAPPLIDDWMLVVSLPVSPREMTNEMTTLSLHITAYHCIIV